jgi:hypothetical protein
MTNQPQHSRTPNIELHIEELVLHGVPQADRYRVAAALQSELTRLLWEQGIPGSFGRDMAIERVDGGRLDYRAGATPETLGQLAARAVYGGMST